MDFATPGIPHSTTPRCNAQARVFRASKLWEWGNLILTGFHCVCTIASGFWERSDDVGTGWWSLSGHTTPGLLFIQPHDVSSCLVFRFSTKAFCGLTLRYAMSMNARRDETRRDRGPVFSLGFKCLLYLQATI